MALTDAKVKVAKASGKRYRLSDSHGLHLEVDPKGRRYWNWVYYWPLSGHERQQRVLRIGPYPQISLKQAREERLKWAELRRNGQDPREVKRAKLDATSPDSPSRFEAVAWQWFELQRPQWSERHVKDQQGKLMMHVLPALGHRDVNEIRVPHAELMLRPLNAAGKGETGKRCMSIACAIMDFAVLRGVAEYNTLSPAKRGLVVKHVKKNFPALKWDDVAQFWQDVTQHQRLMDLQTLNALRLQAMTFVRPGELIAMRWEEIDWNRKWWVIPAARMKKRKEHVVPLSQQALDVLRNQQLISGSEGFVFSSQRATSGHISNMTINMVLNRMGYKGRMCAHGFRALAMTALQEEKGVDRIVIDRQLAHVPETKVAAAYNRAEYIKERTEVMQTWAEMLVGEGMTLPS